MRNKWIRASLIFLFLFAIFTTIFSTGLLLDLTLHIEQVLLLRPISGADCVLNQWVNVGEPIFSICFTLILGLVCLLLGYRRRVLPALLLIMLLTIGIEYMGKQIFPQPIPDSIRHGLDSLDCPQIDSQPSSMKILLSLGLVWKAPPIPVQRLLDAQQSATTPFDFHDAPPDYGYPSGHAIRWCFIGLIASWLIWKHYRGRVVRWLLIGMAIFIAMSVGFLQFYLGFHLFTDLLGGYLLGLSAAFLGIGLLSQNYKQKKLKSGIPTLTFMRRKRLWHSSPL